MGIKYRTSAGTSASNFSDLVVKVGDTLPIGSEIDYDGQSVPAGWQEVDDPNVYSTSETKIGTWIDGKPLYRKIVTGSSTTVDTVLNIPHNISNVDTIMLDATSFIKVGANRFQVNRAPTNYTYPDKNTISTNLNDNYIVLYVGSYLQVSGYSYSFTLLYTKTTD